VARLWKDRVCRWEESGAGMTKEDLITADYLRSIMTYDPATGIFTWTNCPWPRRHNGKQAGVPRGSRGNYIRIAIAGTRYYAHRLAWLYMTGRWPSLQIDHKDGNPQNNKWDNLREASQSQNSANKKRCAAHLPKGVSRASRSHRYAAKITKDYRTTSLGSFPSPEEAHDAYTSAAKIIHGEFAREK